MSIEETLPTEQVDVTNQSTLFDLNSNEMFPPLTVSPTDGKMNKPVWGAGARPAEALVKKGGITQVFQMPAEQQRKIRDQNDRSSLAEICASIGKETRTTIDSSRSGLTNAYTFVIKGEEADIALARRKIWSRLADTITVALNVPESCLGIIIGPGGKKIQALMVETSTKINIPKKYEGTVLIGGDFEGIALAKERIEALIHDKISKSTASLSIERPYLSFMANACGKIKALEQLNELAAQYQVKINVKEGDVIIVNVSGDSKKVTEFSAYLNARREEVKKSIKSVPTQVPKALHRFLIGAKGETLSRMEEDTGCVIVVPASIDVSEVITIYGAESNLLKGLQSVLEKTASLDSQSIKVDESKSKLLLSRYKKSIRDLENKYDVQMRVSEQEVRIDGKKAEVTVSVMEVKNLLKELTNFVLDHISVRSDLIKHIIGKRGHTMDQIQSEYNVDILIADSQSPTEEVKVTIAGPTKETVEKAKESLNQRVQEFADVKTIELAVDEKFHGSLIGHRGANIKSLREKYPETFFDFVDGGKILLRGPSKEVAAAAKELSSTADSLKHEAVLKSYTSDLKLSKDLIEAIVDAQGNLRKSLIIKASKEHNVKLTVNKDCVTLQGSKGDVDTCKSLLEKQIKDIAETGSSTVNIPQEYHALLIGKGGKNVKHLQQKYDIRLSIPKIADETVDDTSIITLTGPRSNLKAAKDEIMEFVEYEKTHRNTETIKVPSSAAPLIRGNAGITIMGICEETDTKIDLEKGVVKEEGEMNITLVGSKEGIAAAQKKIMVLVEESQSYKTELLPIDDASIFKLLTGVASLAWKALVARLQSNDPMTNIYASEAKGSIMIRGKVEAVSEAVKEVKRFLTRITLFVAEKIKIPSVFHREIIGLRGENINRMRDTLNVSISIPKESGVDEITVIGHKEDVAKAKLELLKFVRESKFFNVPTPYRHDLLNSLSDDLVKLELVSKEHRDGIVLSGSQDGLMNITKTVESSLEQLKKLKPLEMMSVPRQFHGALIGRGGKQIEALRSETGCQIHIPSAHSTTDSVELCGSPDSIAKAKNRIQEIIASINADNNQN